MVRAPSTKAPQTSHDVQMIKKEKSREKEFRRAQSINGAFESLQRSIPYLKPEERRQLPKIKTLRLAMQYISHLTHLLDGDKVLKNDCEEVRPLQHSDFRTTVACEMRIRNSYKERAHTQEMDKEVVQRILAREEHRNRRFHMDSPDYATPFGELNPYNFRQIEANQFDGTVSGNASESGSSALSPIEHHYFYSPEQQFQFHNMTGSPENFRF